MRIDWSVENRTVMVTVMETCQKLAIGRSQLWCLVKAGKIRTVKIGKRGVRVPISEIERFIQESLSEIPWGGSNA